MCSRQAHSDLHSTACVPCCSISCVSGSAVPALDSVRQLLRCMAATETQLQAMQGHGHTAEQMGRRHHLSAGRERSMKSPVSTDGL